MKAIVHREHGPPDVLRYEEIDRPVPGDGDVLIKVRAASINPLDWRLMKGVPFAGWGGRKIRRPGRDVAGTVEQVGAKASSFKPGDEVFGVCRGAFAEYACAAESSLVLKPRNVTFEHAASLPIAAVTALQALRDRGRIGAGHRVLVNGAAGGVGTFAAQIAKSYGAEVTGVCSTGNLAMVRSIGASRVVDYTREDFRRSGQTYDIVLDCVGNCAFSDYRRLLRPGGTAVVIGAPRDMPGALWYALRMFVLSWFSRKVVVFVAKLDGTDLALLGDLVASGRITPVIDRRYRLSETADAMGYAERGHARGKVIITPGA